MGLDGVELIMATEEKFGISISDDDAGLIRTPNDLYDCIARELEVMESDSCQTQKAFYLLRNAFRREQLIPRKMFKPDTPLEGLIPEEGRQDEWVRLKERLGASQWPELKVPNRITIAAAIIVLAIWFILSAISVLVLGIHAYVGIAASFIFLFWLAIKSKGLFRPYQTVLAGQTIGTLSEFLVATNPQLFSPTKGWTRERIRVVTRQIIIEQIGVPDDFDDDANFVNDLGVD